jgi:hypothetical protein
MSCADSIKLIDENLMFKGFKERNTCYAVLKKNCISLFNK